MVAQHFYLGWGPPVLQYDAELELQVHPSHPRFDHGSDLTLIATASKKDPAYPRRRGIKIWPFTILFLKIAFLGWQAGSLPLTIRAVVFSSLREKQPFPWLTEEYNAE